MLTEVDIYTTPANDYYIPRPMLAIPLDGSSGYVVKNIDGLGPVKATIVTIPYVGMDGGAYQTANVDMRNIVIKLGYNPSYVSSDPFGDLRRGLYPYLSPKMWVEMHFISTSMEEVSIVGYVESLEPSMFTAEPEVTISILCPDPYFSALAPIEISQVCQVTPETWEFYFTIENLGTADSGLILEITGMPSPKNSMVLSRNSSPVISNPTDFQIMYNNSMLVLAPPYNYLKFTLNTIKGSKSAVVLYYDGDDINHTINVLGYVDVAFTGNVWPTVIPGNNLIKLSVYPVVGEQAYYYANPITVTLSYTPRYVGL